MSEYMNQKIINDCSKLGLIDNAEDQKTIIKYYPAFLGENIDSELFNSEIKALQYAILCGYQSEAITIKHTWIEG